MVGPEFYFRSIIVVKSVCSSRFTKHVLWISERDFWRKWRHLACSMDIILSKCDVLDAEWLLQRNVTIVMDTSATSSSQSLMTQSVCVIGNPSEAG